jgi:hypothetical protein
MQAVRTWKSSWLPAATTSPEFSTAKEMNCTADGAVKVRKFLEAAAAATATTTHEPQKTFAQLHMQMDMHLLIRREDSSPDTASLKQCSLYSKKTKVQPVFFHAMNHTSVVTCSAAGRRLALCHPGLQTQQQRQSAGRPGH